MTAYGKIEVLFLISARPSAHRTTFHAVYVWCSMHAVRQKALRIILSIAARDVRPGCEDGRAQFSKETGV